VLKRTTLSSKTRNNQRLGGELKKVAQERVSNLQKDLEELQNILAKFESSSLPITAATKNAW
jgi:hypothetical protein